MLLLIYANSTNPAVLWRAPYRTETEAKICFGSPSKIKFIRQKILDAGCGTGSYALKLAKWFPTSSIEAIDIKIDEIASKKAPTM